MDSSNTNALVPQLRFQEFLSTGTWQACKLSDLAEQRTESIGDRQYTLVHIKAGEGFVTQTKRSGPAISGDYYTVIRKGDFSYTKTYSSEYPQGCVYMLKEHDEAAVPHTYISFHFNEDCIPAFYNGYFETNYYGRQLAKYTSKGFGSSGVLSIKPSDFFSIMLPTPTSKAEQQKIADCLSSIEELIAAEENKLTALKDQKKGLLQKLLDKTAPDWRFPEYNASGVWKKTSFKDVFGSLHTSVQKARPAILLEGDIAFIGTGPKVGNAYIHDAVPLAPSLVYGSVSRDYCPAFIYAQTLTSGYEKWVARLSGQSKQPGIRAAEYESFTFYCPSLLEQQKIADCLSSIDDRITAQIKKIDNLRVHKRGLLQRLYPSIGEIRG